jgi:hypothetical protein
VIFKSIVKNRRKQRTFKAFIENELKNDTNELLKNAFAKLNSWESRAIEFSDIIENLVKRKAKTKLKP